MTETQANALKAEIERDSPQLICELRPRIHTGHDVAAPDVDDDWALVVTNASTGVVVNITSHTQWREQIEPAHGSM